MREKAFENKVKGMLKDHNCWTLKTWSNGVQRSGVPDLLVCCNGWFVGVELKADKGKPSDLQRWNLRKIYESGGFAWLLYPDMYDDFVEFIEYLAEDNEWSHWIDDAMAIEARYVYLWEGDE